MENNYISKIDVIMPFHRLDKYFFEALNSLDQTIDVDLRIILVDDRPEDSLYFEPNSKFETLVLKTGGVGYAAAILRGCKEIKSEYVAFQDSDDLSAPGRIRMQLDDLLQNNSDLSFCNMVKVNKEGKKKLIQHLNLSLENNHSLPLLLGSFGANSTWVLKSTVIRDGFFIPEVQSLDWGTALSKFQTTKISFLDLNLYFYRSHKGQMTQNKAYQTSVENEIYNLWSSLNSCYELPALKINEFGAVCYSHSTAHWGKEVSSWAKAVLKVSEFSSPREKYKVEVVIGLRALQSFLNHKKLYLSTLELKCIGRFLLITTLKVIFRKLN